MVYIAGYLLIGVILNILLLAVYIAKRLAFEKVLSENELSFRLIVNLVLWPFSVTNVIRGGTFISLLVPSVPVFNLRKAMAIRERELAELERNPPLCGKYVYAHGYDERHNQLLGSVFIYDTDELHKLMLDDLDGVCGPITGQTASMLNWVSQRNPDINVCSKVPDAWDYFHFTHANAIHFGIGQCYCRECNVVYDIKTLKKTMEAAAGGWFYEIITCPQYHLLHELKSLHISPVINRRT